MNELQRAGGNYRERGGRFYEVIEKSGGQREERSVIKQGSEWGEYKDSGMDRKKQEMEGKPDFKGGERVATGGGGGQREAGDC